MAEEHNRENLSEMEQIHRGLEAFLKKEVYEVRGIPYARTNPGETLMERDEEEYNEGEYEYE